MKLFDGNMKLKNVNRNDGGEYKCAAATINQTVSRSMTLSVTGMHLLSIKGTNANVELLNCSKIKIHELNATHNFSFQ